MPSSVEIPQSVKDLIAATLQSAEWLTVGVCGGVLIILFILLLIGRRFGTFVLYFSLFAGLIIFAYDFWSKLQKGQPLADIRNEYLPHFASEILITFLAVAILERSIARRERRHEVRRKAAGGLRFFVRFCEERNLHFRDQDLYILRDEVDAFNGRKDKWIRLMSRPEREHFNLAAVEANNIVTAIGNYLKLPAGTPEKGNALAAIEQKLASLRALYQAFRTDVWSSSDPDAI